jgi:hypothetical protein
VSLTCVLCVHRREEEARRAQEHAAHEVDVGAASGSRQRRRQVISFWIPTKMYDGCMG